MSMGSKHTDTWTRIGDIGILSLVSAHENYLDEPEFIPLDQANKYFNEPDLKGIIIRGSGRHFSAGADLEKLKEMARDEMFLTEKISAGKKLIQLIDTLRLPVVAEIRGACFGGGLEIALACHIRICSENALFAFPETNHGIMPGLGGTITLSRLVGPGRAAGMILSGSIVDAKQALAMGLADYVVPQKELHDHAMDYLGKLTADRDIDVIRSVMQSIHCSQTRPLDEAMSEETKLFCALAIKNMKR